ncbi:MULTISPECIES: hypothetical protein, partial [unclassified Aeromonas]
GDKIRSQTKPFLYLFQLVGAKDPVHVPWHAMTLNKVAPPPLRQAESPGQPGGMGRQQEGTGSGH